MKQTLCFLFVLFSSIVAYSQNKPSLHKSWVKIKTENLSAQEIEQDTLYTRYTFGKSGEVRYSFYPGWDDYKSTWSEQSGLLTMGYTTYKIEELSDTSLSIAADGFRRFRFLSEEHLANKIEHLETLSPYNGLPLYKGNHYVTARYKKEGLRNSIEKELEGYHGQKAAYFRATFVVTTEGKVEDVQIVNGIAEGFNNEFKKQIIKTSKQWQPAMVNGRPVQTQMAYEIKYLDSLVPVGGGRLN